MLRFGNITEVDPAKGYARVTFTDDGIVSDWLQFLTLGAIKDNFSHTFSINEQVACLMDENSEEGVILGAINNDKTPPNNAGEGIFRVKFEDDSVIEYNRNNHKYTLDIKGEIDIKSNSVINIESVTANVKASATANVEAVNTNIKATAIAKIEAPAIQLTGAVAISGALTVGGTITAPGGGAISGNFEVLGQLKGATVTNGTISLGTHKHIGVTTGTGTSGTPTP
jgi:phage baseplate assembly protein V